MEDRIGDTERKAEAYDSLKKKCKEISEFFSECWGPIKENNRREGNECDRCGGMMHYESGGYIEECDCDEGFNPPEHGLNYEKFGEWAEQNLYFDYEDEHIEPPKYVESDPKGDDGLPF